MTARCWNREREQDLRLSRSGTKTPELGLRDGEKRLDQSVHAGGALSGADRRAVVRAGEDGLGGELRTQRPGDLDLAARLHRKRQPERAEVDFGLAGVKIREASGAAKLHLPREGLDQIDADRSLTGRELPLDLDPARALVRALAPFGSLDRHSGSSRQPMTGKTPADQPGEVDIEQLALKISLPVARSRPAAG